MPKAIFQPRCLISIIVYQSSSLSVLQGLLGVNGVLGNQLGKGALYLIMSTKTGVGTDPLIFDLERPPLSGSKKGGW